MVAVADTRSKATACGRTRTYKVWTSPCIMQMHPRHAPHLSIHRLMSWPVSASWKMHQQKTPPPGWARRWDTAGNGPCGLLLPLHDKATVAVCQQCPAVTFANRH